VPRVLLLIKGLGRGGAERLVVGCARLGERFRYEVAYLLPWKDALVGELGAAEVPVHRLGHRPGWVRALRALVLGRGIDLVHVHSPLAAAVARTVLPRRIPVVYTEHNVWPRYRPPTRWANAATFPRNAHVFAVSGEVAASVRYPWPLRRLRVPPVEVLHHGVDPRELERWSRPDGVLAELGIRDGAPVVATVANFKAHKGHRHLLEAASIVRRSLPEARFVLAGAGPTERQVRERAAALGLEGTVVFAGPREDAPRLAAAADLFVLPSEHEGLPVALLEAMALGRAVVATRTGGVPEVVEDGRHGLLVPPADPRALAEAIAELLRDPARRARMGEEGRRRAAAFDLRRAVRRIEDVYEELLGLRGPAGAPAPGGGGPS
jgi:glycosyltransferase involved in cell wall biosynthesis